MSSRTRLALLLVLASLVGCSSEVCEEAYAKMTSCVQALDCNKLGPLERDSCTRTLKSWTGLDKESYLLACRASPAEAEKLAACALDPRTCLCQGM